MPATITTRALPMTRFNLYQERLLAITNAARASNASMDFTPLQFGGFNGQRDSLKEKAVLTITDFEVNNE
jgi:hypothetical protein